MRVCLTLYTRPGCHLCDDLRLLLQELQPAIGFALEEIDITRDAALFARYRYDIPVLTNGRHEIGRGRIDEAMLTLRLRELLNSGSTSQ
jgi:glutaredoxin